MPAQTFDEHMEIREGTAYVIVVTQKHLVFPSGVPSPDHA